MRTSTLPLVALAVALALPGCRKTATTSPNDTPKKVAPRPPPYDVTPLSHMLRPGVAEEVKTRLGLSHLADLPFYDMTLRLDPAGSKLSGQVTVYYLNRTGQALRRIPFLLHPNAPRELGADQTSSMVTVSSVVSLNGPKVKAVHRKRLTLVELELARPLAPNKRIRLKLAFSGTIRKLPDNSNDIFTQALSSLGMSSAGMAASDYGLLASGDGIVTAASAYPMLAPYSGGQFDTAKPTNFGDLAYNRLSHFRARITAPEGYTVVTNLAEQPEEATDDQGNLWWLARGAANRDLVIVAGRGLVQRTKTVDGIVVRSTHLERDAPGGEVMLKAAAGSLELFQKLYGPYPYREMDVAEATLVGGAGGVEFPGLVLVAGMLYRKPSHSDNPVARLMGVLGGLGKLLGGGLLARGKNEPVGGMTVMDRMVADMARFTTAHEVAHQYFAGLVGSDCRQEPALDEPLAQFAAAQYMRHTLGDEAGQRLADTNTKLNYAVFRMVGGEDAPVARPVEQFDNALAYAAIVYGKAPYFYTALQKTLGKQRFEKAMRQAVDTHRYQLITLDRWVKTLEKAAGTDPGVIRELARRWLHQAHGDEDLGVDDSGEQVLKVMLGDRGLADLKQSLSMLGMQPKDLFRMLMGNMMKQKR